MQCTSTVSTTSFRAWGPAAQPGCWLAVELPRVVGHLHAICAATRSHASVLCCAVLCRDVMCNYLFASQGCVVCCAILPPQVCYVSG